MQGSLHNYITAQLSDHRCYVVWPWSLIKTISFISILTRFSFWTWRDKCLVSVNSRHWPMHAWLTSGGGRVPYELVDPPPPPPRCPMGRRRARQGLNVVNHHKPSPADVFAQILMRSFLFLPIRLRRTQIMCLWIQIWYKCRENYVGVTREIVPRSAKKTAFIDQHCIVPVVLVWCWTMVRAVSNAPSNNAPLVAKMTTENTAIPTITINSIIYNRWIFMKNLFNLLPIFY